MELEHCDKQSSTTRERKAPQGKLSGFFSWKLLKTAFQMRNLTQNIFPELRHFFQILEKVQGRPIIHFNHLHGFWSSSLLSQLELFKVLLFGKVCFNLIKLSVFCFISFFFFLIIFYFFSVLSLFCFYRCPENCPEEYCPPVRVRVRVKVGRQFSSGASVLEPFLPAERKEIFYMPMKC